MRIEEEKKRQEEIERQLLEEEAEALRLKQQNGDNILFLPFDPLMDKMMLENFRERSQTVRR